MMSKLPIWSYGAFDLIVHAEMHYLNFEDFDRRVALINFDNSIEISIVTYLNLHPIQRKGYKVDNKEKWLKDFHTKIDFLLSWLTEQKIPCEIEKKSIIWYHGIRNSLYHSGLPGIPGLHELSEIRKTALWIFSVLFDVPDIEWILKEKINEITPKKLKYEKDSEINKNIDQIFGTIEIAEKYNYNTSELLFATDPIAYQEIVEILSDKPDITDL